MPKIDVEKVPTRTGTSYPPPYHTDNTNRYNRRIGDHAASVATFGVGGAVGRSDDGAGRKATGDCAWTAWPEIVQAVLPPGVLSISIDFVSGAGDGVRSVSVDGGELGK